MKALKLSMALFALTVFTMNNSYGQDWPNLEHFSEDNKKIGLPLAGENRVVFMGNSITIGWLNKRPEFFEGKPYINRGISGQTTPKCYCVLDRT